jgi:hypothetical protein
MDNAKPTLAKTGKEQQFTPTVMARLFPKQIVSPEYGSSDVTYNFKAPEAKTVLFESELLPEPLAMQKDAEGIWSVKVNGVANTSFKYCFVVDGMKVADPNNMYLSPDKGFKYSISKAQIKDLGNVKHGIVTYNYGEGTAVYHSAGCKDAPTISLIIGRDDTYESWFKVGGADDIADRLVAEGKIKSCSFFVGETALPGTKILRADDFNTWDKRSKAFEDLLLGKTVLPTVDASYPLFTASVLRH